MLNHQRVTQDIEHWIKNFVEVPHPALGGWPPCPYARRARMDRDYEVRLGLSPLHDLIQISRRGLMGKSVVIIAYDAKEYTHEIFSQELSIANREFLLEKDLLVLEDHPDDAEMVNGVCMNQGTYALALVQCLSELNDKAHAMARQGFYNSWPRDYLQELFQYREDPTK